jgi:nitroreductase
MILESLQMAANREGLAMIVISRRDAEHHAKLLRDLAGCPPWESIEGRWVSGARVVVADVHSSFALTYDMTIHML